MFNTFGKLFCAAALASAALAQSISIIAPAAQTTLQASSSLVVELQELPGPESVVEAGMAIGFIACPNSVCPDVTQNLGSIVYNGPFAPKSNSADIHAYENFTVIVPSFTNGPMQIGVARFYLYGPYSIPKLDYATTTVYVVGSTG
ncbi:hypothetical protein J3R82DRAFT_4965 [Butyriboletus roseoflavus]|nr:hypothetical protein J3R82DRAFT_6253 [Butyriboletus roseoflavus]KAG8219120.1 hypothetical protein J3R82DRAFT_5022 [Butyriboletus roseoflavus]KAG8219145.1 hypothetical protein J3R82DRAFT_4965 [Butyriboletus roseoflavus]